MLPSEPITFSPFDIHEWTNRYRSRLPHWRQEGVTYFVTFRLADSIPNAVYEQWQKEKLEWLYSRGCDLKPPIKADEIPQNLRFEFQQKFNRKLNDYLDGCRGACELKIRGVRDEVISKFNDADCAVGSFVMMPNHVHALMTPRKDALRLEDALKQIKGGSAFEINRLLKREGKLWQKDSFTHVVRSADALTRFQDYIEKNPSEAGLKPDEFTYHRAKYDCL